MIGAIISVLGFAGLSLSGCSCSDGKRSLPPPLAGKDGGFDAGVDAGTDAGFDVEKDTGADASVDAADAGSDAAIDVAADAAKDAETESEVSGEGEGANDAAVDAMDAGNADDASDAANAGDVFMGSDAGEEGDAQGDAGADAGHIPAEPVRPYASLPFCSGRNIFLLTQNLGVGFCGENPVKLYTFPLALNEAPVVAQEILELPQQIGGREVRPTTIRPGGPGKILLPMMSPRPEEDNAATFLMVDLAAQTFVGPQVNATGLQIGNSPIGESLDIAGLADLTWIDGVFWGVLNNPNEDGTYRYGFGIVLPSTGEEEGCEVGGCVDCGVEPNEEEIVENILSNDEDHFSFRTTHKMPTNIADLGAGLIAIQNSGADEDPASIDIASRQDYQLLAGRNVSLGIRDLIALPTLPLDLARQTAYPTDGRSLWEIDLRPGAFPEQENEIALGQVLEGTITSVVILDGGKAAVGDSAGQIFLVGLLPPHRGEILQTIVVGSGLTHLAALPGRGLLAAVSMALDNNTPHIVAVDILE